MNLTIIKHAILFSKPDSLATLALSVIYEQLVVIPLQQAWKRKDHEALRKKYICIGCKRTIRYEVHKIKCAACRRIDKYIIMESRRLDELFG
jgi:hypothetical protein